jgi:hypothetical protein
MKRYFMEYESDQAICGDNQHVYGYTSSLKSAKGYISRARKTEAEYNPRNFRIYDSWADVDPETNHVPCIYAEN